MFQNWGFLLTEIWVLLALAGLLGLIAGWIMWGRRIPRSTRARSHAPADIVDRDRQIAALKSAVNEREAELEKIKAELVECRISMAKAVATPSALSATTAGGATKPTTTLGSVPPTAASGVGTRPAGLDGPREGKADDLKLIKGVGPQLEKLCNDLGYYHFDQIARWTPAEVEWVDDNLVGFTGRVSRDNWIYQAKLLAAGAETEFSKKMKNDDD